MNKKYLFAILVLTALLLLETSVYALQSGSIDVGVDGKFGKNGGGCEVTGECAPEPKIDCTDPGAVGKKFCEGGTVISSCKDSCALVKSSGICSGWNANSVEQCKAQCSTQNGCKKG